jgi:hypothetical protein
MYFAIVLGYPEAVHVPESGNGTINQFSVLLEADNYAAAVLGARRAAEDANIQLSGELFSVLYVFESSCEIFGPSH